MDAVETYLRTRRALLPDEIEAARKKAVPGLVVKIMDNRFEAGYFGDEYLSAGNSSSRLIRKATIQRVIGNIIEFDHNISCTVTEFALYLRDPYIPCKKRGQA